MQKATLGVLWLQWHINDLHQFQYGTVEVKKPLNDNFLQGFGQKSKAGAPSIYSWNSLF